MISGITGKIQRHQENQTVEIEIYYYIKGLLLHSPFVMVEYIQK